MANKSIYHLSYEELLKEKEKCLEEIKKTSSGYRKNDLRKHLLIVNRRLYTYEVLHGLRKPKGK